jgi:hypothetical protein
MESEGNSDCEGDACFVTGVLQLKVNAANTVTRLSANVGLFIIDQTFKFELG